MGLVGILPVGRTHLLLVQARSLLIHDIISEVYKCVLLWACVFLLQIAKTYDIPPEMIKNVFKKTKKGFVCLHSCVIYM